MAGLPAFMVFRVLRLQQQARHAILVIVRQVDAVTLPPHSGVENPSLDLREPPLYPNVHVTAGHHGAGTSPAGSASQLCAESPAQIAIVLLALPPADHFLIERDRGQFAPSRRRRMDGQRPCRALAEDPGRTQPRSCLSPALQLKREWSPWPEFGSDRGNPRDLSKG
jgi:hypothetical protein